MRSLVSVHLYGFKVFYILIFQMKETLQLRAARSNSGTSNRGARLDSDGSSYIASTENNHEGKFIVLVDSTFFLFGSSFIFSIAYSCRLILYFCLQSLVKLHTRERLVHLYH